MKILTDRCIGCGNCVVVCPVQAIELIDDKAIIDKELCVECSVCYRYADCPTNAVKPSKLKWPRVVRNPFSDVISTHKLTGVPGRGTEEMKTNDVTNRFKEGEIGFSIEIGRPGIGTVLKKVNFFTRRLTPLGVNYEEQNPVTALLKEDRMEIKEEIENEHVLSAIIEFKVEREKVKDVLEIIKRADTEINTVFSVGVVSTFQDNNKIPVKSILTDEGFEPRPNAKINVGLGKIPEEEP
jgi:NAD-dependent dihydropyrimidine dehydrogenase PreA subunit